MNTPVIHIYPERKPLMRTPEEVSTNREFIDMMGEILRKEDGAENSDPGDEMDDSPIMYESSTDDDTSAEMWASINPPR